jgi:hypothetical protein
LTIEAISPLRRRMIEEMTIRHFSAKTQQQFSRAVKNFADFLGRCPDSRGRHSRTLNKRRRGDNSCPVATKHGSL